MFIQETQLDPGKGKKERKKEKKSSRYKQLKMEKIQVSLTGWR